MKQNIQQKTIRKLIAIALVLAAIYLFAGVAQQVYATLQLRSEKKTVESELEQLISENERLLANKKKFEDPNYIVTYAHGAYMFSREDEKVFYLPAVDETGKPSETVAPSPTATSSPVSTPTASPEVTEEPSSDAPSETADTPSETPAVPSAENTENPPSTSEETSER